MSFGEAISTCFAKYFVFSGRASRSEYWYFFLFGILVGFGLLIAFPTFTSGVIYPLQIAIWIGLFPASLSAGVRRLHDTGRSGYWLLANFAMLVGAVVAFVIVPDIPFAVLYSLGWLALGWLALGVTFFIFTLLPSNEHENKYGPNPLSAGNETKLEPNEKAMPVSASRSADARIATQPIGDDNADEGKVASDQ